MVTPIRVIFSPDMGVIYAHNVHLVRDLSSELQVASEINSDIFSNKNTNF